MTSVLLHELDIYRTKDTLSLYLNFHSKICRMILFPVNTITTSLKRNHPSDVWFRYVIYHEKVTRFSIGNVHHRDVCMYTYEAHMKKYIDSQLAQVTNLLFIGGTELYQLNAVHSIIVSMTQQNISNKRLLRFKNSDGIRPSYIQRPEAIRLL